MGTIAQEFTKENPKEGANPKKLLQVLVPEDVRARIRVAAAIRGCGLAEIVCELATKHLPSVPAQEIVNEHPDK